MEPKGAIPYLSLYFIASQCLLLYLVYLFTRVDWRALFTEKKLRANRKPRLHNASRAGRAGGEIRQPYQRLFFRLFGQVLFISDGVLVGCSYGRTKSIVKVE
jgi:hypothetical protein